MSKQKLMISNEKKADITKGMIGLFFEDINYGADGGLYAEMIENRSFEFLEAKGDYDDYETYYDGLYGWEGFPKDGKGAELTIKTDSPVNEKNPHYLSFKSSVGQLGFTNKAYDGIYLKKGVSYKISCYMRTDEEYEGNVQVAVYKDSRVKAYAILAGNVTSKWEKYEAVIEAPEHVEGGEFVIELSLIGNVEFDFISMIPEDAVKGIFRRDLVQLLKEMKPGFLRFPGGCIIEGNNLDNRYRWKDSIGSIEQRTNNWNRWAVHENKKETDFTGPYSHYNQSLGIGYYEYFLLCEWLEAAPIPVVNVGLACQYQSTEMVALDSKEFQSYIQDALDLIEFAIGSVTSTWGAVRSEMGHPEPFDLEMIGIGNEQWETDKSEFFKRYTLFENAIHSRYPEMKLIGSAGPDVTSNHYFKAWDFYQENASKENFVYAVDEHYYQSTQWLYENIGFYDKYPRNVKVFSGEYAAHVSGGMNNSDANTMGAALAEAAFLTGVERNADVVVLASYAPLLARIGYTQWSPDLIWFDSQSAYGTPSYYVQKLYGKNMGTYVVKSRLEGYGQRTYQVVSYDEENKELVIKLINASDKEQEVEIIPDSTYSVKGGMTVEVLNAFNLDDVNSINEPEKVVPVNKEFADNGTYLAPAYSMSVIRITVQ